MAQQVKLNIIQSLFRFVSFLADKTNGWAMFVKPKILLGSIIVGLAACSSNAAKQNTLENTDNAKPGTEKSDTAVLCDDAVENPTDSITGTKQTAKKQPLVMIEMKMEPMCYEPASCYLIVSTETLLPEKNVDTHVIYQASEVETLPDFPGGRDALYTFIGENLNYHAYYEGIVVCSFIIEKDGSISNVEIVKSLYPEANNEVVRIIKSMPQWIPGEQNGEKVRVKYLLPYLFLKLPAND